jgi:hypothetical protein
MGKEALWKEAEALVDLNKGVLVIDVTTLDDKPCSAHMNLATNISLEWEAWNDRERKNLITPPVD